MKPAHPDQSSGIDRHLFPGGSGVQIRPALEKGVMAMTNTSVTEPMTLLLEDLVQAAKGAERLISVMFEIGALQGEPFLAIWSNLEQAIDKAEAALGKDAHSWRR